MLIRAEFQDGTTLKHINGTPLPSLVHVVAKFFQFSLCRFVNILEEMGGSSWLADNVGSKNISLWAHPLVALNIGLHQVGLSGWKLEECNAIQNELLSWLQKGISDKEGIFNSVTCIWFRVAFFFLFFFLP